jgi:hypothetical protein
MQISLRLAAFLSIVFAATCLWFAIEGFTSLASITDPDEVSGAKSFAWFWTFLTVVGAVIALLSWKVAQAQDKDS